MPFPLFSFPQYHHRFAEGSVIVYCNRQADTANLSAFLRTQQVDADWSVVELSF